MMKRSGRKWLLVLLIPLLLLALAAAVVQVILWTDKPGEWVLSALSDSLGIELAADDFNTAWTGRTRLHNLTARRPLEDEPFLLAETLELNHNSLLSLALTRRFRLDAIQLDEADLRLEQSDNGRWNIEDIIVRFRSGDEPGEPVSELNLPDIEGRNLRITVLPSDGPQTVIGPVSITADSDRLTWRLAAEIPSVLDLRGRMAAVRPFSHELSLELRNLGEIIELPAGNPELEARWSGRFTADGIAGTLDVESARLADAALSGSARVSAASGRVTADARQMTIVYGGFPVSVTDGRAVYEEANLRIQSLTAEALGTVATLSGTWNIPESRVETEGRWTAAAPESLRQHSGTWQGQVGFAPDGYKTVNMTVRGRYEDSSHRFTTQLTVDGSGSDWLRSRWNVEASPLYWQGPDRTIEAGPARLELALDWPLIRLDRLSAGNIRDLDARGRYSADSNTWQLTLDADGIRLDTETGEQADLVLRASGDSEKITVEQLVFNKDALHFRAASDIALPDGWIENGHITLSGQLPAYESGSPLARFSANPWQVNTVLNGTVFPPDLNVNGQMKVRAPAVDPNVARTLDIPFDLRLTSREASLRTASFISERGSWFFRGFYNFADTAGRLFVDLDSIPLELLSEYFSSTEYRGTLSGELTADFPSPDLRNLDLNGNWNLTDFKAASFAAEKIQGQVHMRSGRAELQNIIAQQGLGVIRGSGTITLRRDRRADFTINATDWTYPSGPSPVAVIADANAILHVDLSANRVRGEGTFAAEPIVLEKPVGNLNFTADFNEKTLTLRDIGGTLLDGSVSGRVRIPFQEWMNSRAQLTFEDIRLGRLPEWQRRLEGLEGSLSGRIDLEQIDDPRRLEPLELILRSSVEDGRLRGAPIGGLDLTAYAGPNRILMTDSDLSLFAGHIETRARMTQHGDNSFLHLTSEIRDLSLPDLVRVIDPNAEPVAGLINGTATFITTPTLENFTSRADLELTESDLINNNIIGTLYRSLAFQFGKTRPEGTGTVKLRSEGTSLQITSFYYFNRGVEIRGSARIEDITLGPDSPVSGLVMATTRPLKGINLPGIKELDRLMEGIQTGAAVVRLEGTLGSVQPRVVPLPEVNSAIRSLLWGQLRDEEE